MAVEVRTPDDRLWQVIEIGSATRPNEWLILARCDQEAGYLQFASDQPLETLSATALATAVQRAAIFAPKQFSEWVLRPELSVIQPPARHFKPGDVLTGIGKVTIGCSARLQLFSGQSVTVTVTEQYGEDIFIGIVEDVASGTISPQRLLRRTVGFHRNHVFAVQ